jgi:WD40 repeat protein
MFYQSLKGHTGAILDLCIIPDGRVVSASADNNLRVWNLDTLTCERILSKHTNKVNAVQEVGSKNILSGSSDNKLIMWNINTGASKIYRAATDDSIYDIDLGKDNATISYMTTEDVQFIDIASGNFLRRLRKDMEQKRNNTPYSFSCIKIVPSFLIIGCSNGNIKVVSIV